jgi:hypothetical protein
MGAIGQFVLSGLMVCQERAESQQEDNGSAHCSAASANYNTDRGIFGSDGLFFLGKVLPHASRSAQPLAKFEGTVPPTAGLSLTYLPRSRSGPPLKPK